jgi:S-formylglutathione hydrolase FrmB
MRRRLWACAVFLVGTVLWLCGCQASVQPPLQTADVLRPTPAPTSVLPQVTQVLPEPSKTPFVPTPTLCAEKSGRFETQEIHTDAQTEPFAFRVFLPPCFDSSGSTRYPVLYLLHGQGSTDDQWERLGAGTAAADLISSGAAQPFLIVLPQEEDTLANPFESSYGTILTKDLVPWVDAQYPTCSQRGCRAIGGLSRGAAWAVYLGLEHWQLFGAVGAHSLPPFLGMESKLPGELGAIPQGQAPDFYMDIGWADRYRQAASNYENLLNRAGVAHEWYLFEGQHDETYWQAHVRGYLTWYAGWFKNGAEGAQGAQR